MVFGRHDNVLAFVQDDVAAVIGRNGLRMDDRRKADIDRIHVGAEADRGNGFGFALRQMSRQFGCQDAFVAQADIGQAEFFQFVLQLMGHVPLAFCAGDDGAAVSFALGRDLHIAVKPRN